MNQDAHRRFSSEFVRSQHRVFGYIVSLVANRSDAEEIFQQVCLILWEKWNQYDASRPFISWACGIALNVVRNHRRKMVGTPQLLDGQLLNQIAETYERHETWLDKRRQALENCLSKLSQDQRSIVDSAYFRQQSIIDVAAKLGLTPAAATMRLQRIRRSLFECINRAMALEGR
jgi:RNA polymerase sigma-70 factor, ECF subfamily